MVLTAPDSVVPSKVVQGSGVMSWPHSRPSGTTPARAIIAGILGTQRQCMICSSDRVGLTALDVELERLLAPAGQPQHQPAARLRPLRQRQPQRERPELRAQGRGGHVLHGAEGLVGEGWGADRDAAEADAPRRDLVRVGVVPVAWRPAVSARQHGELPRTIRQHMF